MSIEFFVEYMQKFIPDSFVRFFLKIILWSTKNSLLSKDFPQKELRLIKKMNNLKTTTFDTKDANKQHYEVPTDFFLEHLGKKLKYSSCEWDNCLTLEDAEIYTISKYQEYLKLNHLEDGSYILEIGNGWGSLCLSNAEKYPNLNFESFSNSATQIAYIQEMCLKRGIKNLKCWKQDIDDFIKNDLNAQQKYSRIVSIECIEHCRGYGSLFKKMSKVLKNDGFCFIQILGHSYFSYLMNNNTWMGRNFFTGGTIPSMHLFDAFNEDLIVSNKEILSGNHYSKTLDAWLNKLYQKKSIVMPILRNAYGNKAEKHFEGWRMFYLMCSESFKYNKGKDWCVGYFTLIKR